MAILVTGAFGNAGRYIVEELLEQGRDVLALDLRNRFTVKGERLLSHRAVYLPGKLKVHWSDLTDRSSLEAAFAQEPPEAVVHIAFVIPPFSENKPEHARNVNVEGTRRLVELAKQYCPKVPFVFSSSVTVFGPTLEEKPPITLKHKLVPTSNYTGHKIECETMLRKSKLDWRIIRFSAVMNPTFRPGKELRNFGMQIDLRTRVEPVHVRDLAVAVRNMIDDKRASRKVFIGSGGESCRMVFKDFLLKSLKGAVSNLRDEHIPWEKFRGRPYYLDWYDTRQTEKILKFQTRDVDDYVRDLRNSLPVWQRSLAAIFRPLVVRALFSEIHH